MWNSGTETILGSDIILPLVINIPEGTRLLDLQPVRISRKEVTQTVANIRKQVSGDSIQFEFRVLEPGDGISATLLYESQGDVEFSLKGGVTGIREITDSMRIARERRWSAPWKMNAPIFLLLGATLGGVILLIAGVVGWISLAERFFPKHASRISNILGNIFITMAALFLLGLVITALVEPWMHPERVIPKRIRDYVPSELVN